RDKKFWLTVTVELSGPASGAVTVDYATSGGTATAGSDYEATSGTLYFSPGQTTATFTIRILSEKTPESDETIGIVLSNPTGPATLLDGAGVITIVDDDSAVMAADAAPAGFSAEPLEEAAIAPSAADAVELWAAEGFDVSRLAGVRFVITDLAGLKLAETAGATVYVDVDAAGWGWSVNGGSIDLVAVLQHELGHVLGLTHADATRFPIMAPVIEPMASTVLGTAKAAQHAAPATPNAATINTAEPATLEPAVLEPVTLKPATVEPAAPARAGVESVMPEAHGPAVAAAPTLPTMSVETITPAVSRSGPAPGTGTPPAQPWLALFALIALLGVVLVRPMQRRHAL
ncbi:MAG: Calx-beta domain-containing protein, partial [Actinomycetota bacterium]|nr:Calx-beta domain-containing protein [Actinomycetota bacterium]